MLGEAALTAADAARYFAAYAHAIAAVGRSRARRLAADAPSVSVKLSALSPRYELAQSARAVRELGAQALGARARGARCRHRAHGGRRGSGSPRAVARDLRDGVCATRARRLRRARPRGAGVSETRAARARWLGDARARRRPHDPRAARQGRLLGHRDQARPGAGSRRLPGVHAQVQHGRLVSRVRESVADSSTRSSIRSSRRTTRTRSRGCSRSAPAARSSFSACTVWARSCTASSRAARFRAPLPRLRAGRKPRAPVAVPRAAAARERREYLVRQSARACGRAVSDAIVADPVDDARGVAAVAHPRIPLPRALFAPERMNSRG